jgi:tRNA threonylcarbamoyladenosine dehydratase
MNENSIFVPVRIRIGSDKTLKNFSKKHNLRIIDTYLEQLEELFFLRNPRFRFDKNYQKDFQSFVDKHVKAKSLVQQGSWFYFPWLKSLIHYLSESDYLELRTGRNRNLITKYEQKTYYNSCVGILGLSVGSHVALTLVMNGGSKYLKIADPDTISGSNLNRIRTGAQNIGLKKAIVVARQIYEMNPYSVVEVFQEGLSEKNFKSFFLGRRKIDLLIEEMDNPFLKILVRYETKKLGIPVVMAADNADGIIVDVERYDLNKKMPILHGLLGAMKAEDLKTLDPKDLPRVMAKIAGANLSTLRMIESVQEVGKTLYSWPQLGNAATLCGSILTYLTKAILLRKNIRSGRTSIDVESLFIKPSSKDNKLRDKLLKKMGVY